MRSLVFKDEDSITGTARLETTDLQGAERGRDSAVVRRKANKQRRCVNIRSGISIKQSRMLVSGRHSLHVVQHGTKQSGHPATVDWQATYTSIGVFCFAASTVASAVEE